jgi:hypothetical protein
MSEHWLKLLLRVLGAICVLAVIPLFAPRSWLDAGHRFVGMGAFPEAPIAEYLARSVCALSAFYGGLLLLLARDVVPGGRHYGLFRDWSFRGHAGRCSGLSRGG